MPGSLFFLLVFLGGGLIAFIYVRWAQANYPESWQWELLLIGVPFAWGFLLFLFALLPSEGIGFSLLYATLFGLFQVFVNRYLWMPQMLRLMPRRPEPPDTNKQR